MAVLEDITEARRLEWELRERRSDMELLQQQQVAAQTAAAIAHELNQPLGAISAYNEVALRLLGDGGPDKLARAIEGSAEQALRAGRTLHELLAFLQYQEIQAEPVDINAVVKEAIAVPFNVWAPSVVLPFLNVTVPVGVGPPVAPVTVAVKVTA